MEKYITTKQGISNKNLSRNQHFSTAKLIRTNAQGNTTRQGNIFSLLATSLFMNYQPPAFLVFKA